MLLDADVGNWEENIVEETVDEETVPQVDTANDFECDDVPVQRAVEAPKKKVAVEKPIAEPRKEHVNIVFIGHVDAGKSTIGGHLLYLTGKLFTVKEKYLTICTCKSKCSYVQYV